MNDGDKDWFEEQFRIINERIDTSLEKVETKLLTAFYQYAGPSEKRQRSLEARIEAMDMDLASLKERIDKMEGRGPKSS